MRETICTIPVNEIFEVADGCPICRMRDHLENYYVDYITGAAMMEPDIRLMTNNQGFCDRHYRKMFELGKQRLPICLMLVSHLSTVERNMLKKPDSSSAKKIEALENNCFICNYIEKQLAHEMETVYKLYKTEPEFRALFEKQEHICLPHYRRLLTEGKKQLGGQYEAFSKMAHRLVTKQSSLLAQQLKMFEDSFDHRNAGVPMPAEARDSLERTVEFLVGHNPAEGRKQ